MKFSTRTTYGLRGLTMLAKYYPASISLGKIAVKEKISEKYLEQIFAKLKRDKWVKAEVGASGGYSLIMPPESINIENIIKTLEGDLSFFHCYDKHDKIKCSRECACPAAKVLNKIQNSVCQTLRKITLQDLIS